MISGAATPCRDREEHADSVERDEAAESVLNPDEQPPTTSVSKQQSRIYYPTKPREQLTAELRGLHSTDEARENCSYIAVYMRKQAEYVQVLKMLNDKIHEVALKIDPTEDDEILLQRLCHDQREAMRGLRDCAECIRYAVEQISSREFEIAEIVAPYCTPTPPPQEKPMRGRGRFRDKEKDTGAGTPAHQTQTPILESANKKPHSSLRQERLDRAVKDRTPLNGKATPTPTPDESEHGGASSAPGSSTVGRPHKGRRSAAAAAAAAVSAQVAATSGVNSACTTPLHPSSSRENVKEEEAPKSEKRPKRSDAGSHHRKNRSSGRLDSSGRTMAKTSTSTSSVNMANGKPKDEKKVRESRESTQADPEAEEEQTYCMCDRVSYGEMICCDNDKCEIEWFHFECVELKTKPKGKWFCPDCRHPDSCKLPKPASVTQSRGQKETPREVRNLGDNNGNNRRETLSREAKRAATETRDEEPPQ